MKRSASIILVYGTLRPNRYRLIPNHIVNARNGKAKGFICQASTGLSVARYQNALVIPHAGHGIPKTRRMGQASCVSNVSATR